MARMPLYVAVHEAGHAVAMLASESPRPIQYLSVIDQPAGQQGFTAATARFQPAYGHFDALPAEEPALRRSAWLDVVELFAGNVAEKRFRGRSEIARLLHARSLAHQLTSETLVPEPGEDADKIMVRLRSLDGANAANQFVRGWTEAEVALRPHWKRVVELGRWLHNQGRIEASELYGWWNARL